ncbi:MAG: hypothetical protein K2M77_03850 [Muribaculaceae bacterium]|nr:hypothetical protein [Muribaculaceae bacterium]
MTSKLRHIIFVLAMIVGYYAAAQSSDTIISFVNIYPGPEIYELEGHSVLRVQMPGSDMAIRYAT